MVSRKVKITHSAVFTPTINHSLIDPAGTGDIELTNPLVALALGNQCSEGTSFEHFGLVRTSDEVLDLPSK